MTSRFDRALDVSTQISSLGTAAVDVDLAGTVCCSVSRRLRALAAASRDAARRAAVDEAKVRCGGALCRKRSLRLRLQESVFDVVPPSCSSTSRGDNPLALDDEVIAHFDLAVTSFRSQTIPFSSHERRYRNAFVKTTFCLHSLA